MTMNILYQFNDAYVPFAGVSMTSLFENNKHIDKINIHVLEEDVSEVNRSKLEENARKYNRHIEFYETKQLVEQMREMGIPAYRNSYATNMKMFVPIFFDDSIDRLLYIDSDTIITSALDSLYEQDMHRNVIAMALDSLGGRHKQYLGFDKNDDYFNAGIILYDMRKWREEKCTEQITNHVKNVRAHYMSPDQDLLNVVLKNHIQKMGLENNLQPIHMAYSYRVMNVFFHQDNYYSKEEVEGAVNKPVILHTFRFLGEFPWHKGTQHPAVKYFDEYMAKSVWKDYQKEESQQNSMVFKIERALYKYLPKVVFISIFKVNFEWFIYKAGRASIKQKNIAEM